MPLRHGAELCCLLWGDAAKTFATILQVWRIADRVFVCLGIGVFSVSILSWTTSIFISEVAVVKATAHSSIITHAIVYLANLRIFPSGVCAIPVRVFLHVLGV